MRHRRIHLFALLCLLPLSVFAQNTPIGRWRSIDDATDRPKALIEVYQTTDGTLAAKIVRILDLKNGPNPLCDHCGGDRRNRPMVGMVIAWGMKRQGDAWTGGRILDPENGREYSVRMTPSADGDSLEVRGFLGFSLLGRTQTWRRE